MDSLMLSLTNNSGLWENVMNFFFSFIGNVGWVVIILTILIRLIMVPFEFLQKKGMKKMMAATSLMQPEMQKLKEKCGNNQQLYNQKMQELYKKHNINPAAGCGPMFLYLVLSSVVFITFFNCLRGVSSEQIVNQYNSLETVYTTAYTYYMDEEPLEINGVKYKIKDYQLDKIEGTEFEYLMDKYDELDQEEKQQYASARDYAKQKRVETLSQIAVVDGINLYKEANDTEYITLQGFTDIKQGFLWIKNIYRSDHYNSVFPSAKEYIKEANISFKQKEFLIDASQKDNFTDGQGQSLVVEKNGEFYVKAYYKTLSGEFITKSENASAAFINDYNSVTGHINKTYNGWNGYLILVILIAVLTIFGGKLTNFGSKTRDKKGFEVDVKPQKQNNTMVFVLTGLFVIIAWSYTAAFALYIATSSLISIPISIGINYLINGIEKREALKNEISYSRYNKGDK